jgi:hypothetical protein
MTVTAQFASPFTTKDTKVHEEELRTMAFVYFYGSSFVCGA